MSTVETATSLRPRLLENPEDVVRCLVMYTDWWQPDTTSVLQVAASRSQNQEGFRFGLIETLDERGEICRRMDQLNPRDRHLLFLWYVEQRPTEEIAKTVGISRRQCFRRKARAIRILVDLGDPQAS